MRKAAIYCRISQDREGAGLGVSRQETDCRALAEPRGWHVIEVYADNDVSAFSGKPRPQWKRLLTDIDAGTIDAIVCWHVDRLTRSPRELEDVIDLADRRGIDLATVIGEIDQGGPDQRAARAADRGCGPQCRRHWDRRGPALGQAAPTQPAEGAPVGTPGQRKIGPQTSTEVDSSRWGR